MKQQLNEVKALQKIAGIIKEGEQTDKELYDLQKQFMPAFEDYVELYAIAALESPEGEYTEVEKNFARQLKDVLFKFKKGVI
jgi:Ribonuclease G/E